MKPTPEKPTPAASAALRRRAEKFLKEQPAKKVAKDKTDADLQRRVHELQVHHIELEMQNVELQEARNSLETQLEKYTGLYDFAPVGYFSLDELGVVLEVNLLGADLLGVERSRLINRRLSHFVSPANQ